MKEVVLALELGSYSCNENNYKWSERNYINLAVSVFNDANRNDLQAALLKYSHSLESFLIEYWEGSVNVGLYSSLELMPKLQEFTYITREPVRRTTRRNIADFPYPYGSTQTLANMKSLVFIIYDDYNELTVENLKSCVELSPNLEKLSITLYSCNTIKHNLSSVIETCSFKLKKLAIKCFSDGIFILLDRIDLPNLKELELTFCFLFSFSSIGITITNGMKNLMKRFKERNQKIQLKLKLDTYSDYSAANESILDALDSIDDLAIVHKFFNFEKTRNYVMDNLKVCTHFIYIYQKLDLIITII